MELDLHVFRFDWAGGPSGIGAAVADLAKRAEAIGVRALSFMDHFFQMDWAAPAEDPMLEGYTALGFVAGRTQRLRLRLLVTGVTYRHPGLLAKSVTTLDVVSNGRAELGMTTRLFRQNLLQEVGRGACEKPLRKNCKTTRILARSSRLNKLGQVRTGRQSKSPVRGSQAVRSAPLNFGVDRWRL